MVKICENSAPRVLDQNLQPPKWLPPAAQVYIDHICNRKPIRAIAREKGCHASTILRQIRRIEAVRDDPLKDEALEKLTMTFAKFNSPSCVPTEYTSMRSKPVSEPQLSEERINKEARRILRRLCESKAYLLVSRDMEKAAVFRETVPGRKTRTAVLERDVASAFALREWIEGENRGRVAVYSITNVGRSALKRMLTEEQANRRNGNPDLAKNDPFQDQHREYGERTIIEDDGVRKIRYNLAESPLTALARKKNKNGTPYLSVEQLDAGERLREDFEIAQIGPKVTQNWDKFLTSASHGKGQDNGGPSFGPAAARARVSEALSALGPGLADIAFRCCCFLEGLEAAEKRLGWSARSGKIVLAIALQRLADHYGSIKDTRMVG